MDAVEVYVLCGSRSKSIADTFLTSYAPSRIGVANEYPYPEFVDEPERTFETADELIDRLASEQNSSYSIYWNCIGGPEQVMLFFTNDGHMIAGIGGPKTSLERTLTELCELVGGRFGYVTSGSCPPDTFEEFESLSRNSTLPCIVDGQLRNRERS